MSSDFHNQCILHIVNFIKRNFNNDSNITIYVDHFTLDYQNPKIINGYRPDVFAFGHKNNPIIIGEAKSPGDIENIHTNNQLYSFLNYLVKYDPSYLIFSTRWDKVNLSKNNIKYILGEIKSEFTPEIITLDDQGDVWN